MDNKVIEGIGVGYGCLAYRIEKHLKEEEKNVVNVTCVIQIDAHNIYYLSFL